MEYYDWKVSASKKSVETLFGKAHTDITHADIYSQTVDALMNEGAYIYYFNVNI